MSILITDECKYIYLLLYEYIIALYLTTSAIYLVPSFKVTIFIEVYHKLLFQDKLIITTKSVN